MEEYEVKRMLPGAEEMQENRRSEKVRELRWSRRRSLGGSEMWGDNTVTPVVSFIFLKSRRARPVLTGSTAVLTNSRLFNFLIKVFFFFINERSQQGRASCKHAWRWQGVLMPSTAVLMLSTAKTVSSLACILEQFQVSLLDDCTSFLLF